MLKDELRRNTAAKTAGSHYQKKDIQRPTIKLTLGIILYKLIHFHTSLTCNVIHKIDRNRYGTNRYSPRSSL